MPTFYPLLYWGLMRTLNASYHVVSRTVRPEESKKIKYSPLGLTKEKIGLWKAEKTSQQTVQKKENGDMQYYVEIYITNTSVKNGPGHVSASMIKKSNDGAELAKHTSYMPGNIGSIINAVSLTNIPVPASHFPEMRDEDVNKSDLIIRVPISEVQFKKGLERQTAIEKGVKDGYYLYTTVGPINLIAYNLTWLINQQIGGAKMTANYIKDTGFNPNEDHTGNLMIADSHYPEQQTQCVVLNCTAAIQSVLKEMGIELNEQCVLPATLGQCVLNEHTNAKIVKQSLVAPKYEAPIEENETTELYRRSLD